MDDALIFNYVAIGVLTVFVFLDDDLRPLWIALLVLNILAVVLP